MTGTLSVSISMQKLLACAILVSALVTIASMSAAAQQPDIVIHERPGFAKSATRVEVEDLIRNELLADARYKNEDIARIDVRFSKEDGEQFLVAHLQWRKIYLLEIAVIPLSGAKGSRRIEVNVTPERAEQLLGRDKKAALWGCPDPTAEAVFATIHTEIPSAVAGISMACQNARAADMTCRTLVGDEATVEAYQAYLTLCPRLKAFGNIGHGSPFGIGLAENKMLSAKWFASLQGDALANKVVYFNSCQVHNDPLKSAITKAGARVYVGGIENLLIGQSEEVLKCFVRESMPLHKNMKPNLVTCERDYYPTHRAGHHGYEGDPDTFERDFPLVLAAPALTRGERSATADPSPAIAPQVNNVFSSAEVEEMQRLLNRYGYDLQIDGRFGTQTRSALEGWQRSRRLPSRDIPPRAALEQLRAAGT